ncbi:hypothetical protein [Bradyrhizobium sp. S69]|uniref:hypothetical protein n=1 Tax=Bradyrhizobium sp. S69 TaxID=1641856 RepID=UPI00131E81F3|nr:hypothetical protein [Bradyrhizobium sp. S69]
MVALKTERRVYMWQVAPRPMPKEAPVNVSLAGVVGTLKAAYDSQTAELFLNADGRVLPVDAPLTEKDPKNRVYISDFEEDDGYVTILINRGDPTVSDTAFINAVTDGVRTIVPETDESQGWSAHLVISKYMSGQNVHRACFERMPHATSWFVEALIKRILEMKAVNNPAYIFQKPKRKGGKIVYETFTYRDHLSIKKVPSERLKEDIKQGELSAIVLIDTKAKFTGPDSPDVIKSVERRLVIKPDKAVAQAKVLSYFKKLIPWAKEQKFDTIQVKLTELPGGATASPRFLIEQGDATETLYVRTQRLLEFGEILESCYAKIMPEIKSKMIALMQDNSKW